MLAVSITATAWPTATSGCTHIKKNRQDWAKNRQDFSRLKNKLVGLLHPCTRAHAAAVHQQRERHDDDAGSSRQERSQVGNQAGKSTRHAASFPLQRGGVRIGVLPPDPLQHDRERHAGTCRGRRAHVTDYIALSAARGRSPPQARADRQSQELWSHKVNRPRRVAPSRSNEWDATDPSLFDTHRFLADLLLSFNSRLHPAVLHQQRRRPTNARELRAGA